MSLTPKQEAFCQAVLTETNSSDAYRKAYPTVKSNAQTINRAAKTLMDNPKIQARLAELRAPVIESARLTLEEHLNDLKTLRDRRQPNHNSPQPLPLRLPEDGLQVITNLRSQNHQPGE